ncbi:hypothetical protein AC16_3131 [Escherichia coli 2-177-06_S3_C2]|nr:hypothetical protein AC16_3131 [Escherichia coli 2-177-06_S3_C2]KEO17084.1 hypothetical protein AC44_0013 [Escherichia coli 2-177-06_S3_C3]
MFLLFPFFRGNFDSFSYRGVGTALCLYRLYELTSDRITNYFLFSHKNTSS